MANQQYRKSRVPDLWNYLLASDAGDSLVYGVFDPADNEYGSISWFVDLQTNLVKCVPVSKWVIQMHKKAILRGR